MLHRIGAAIGADVLDAAGDTARINPSLDRPRHNLPAQLTPFIGREAELADLQRLLEQPGCRLVMILGPGGIGKTRLALAAAQARLDLDREVVCFVALAALSSAELPAATWADSLGVQVLAAADPHE